MNFNDYQSKGFDTSFDYAQDHSTIPCKTASYPVIGHPVIYPTLSAPGGVPAAEDS